MSDKLEMPIEQFAEAVSIENARLNKRIEKLETGLEHTMECFIGARAALKDCIIERDEARKALERNPEKSVYKEGYRAVEEAMGHPSPEFWVEKKYD
jgi:hypothetical protein